MKIYSWNVNGLRAIARKGFVDWVKDEDADIICIQETKLQKNQLKDKFADIDGYSAYFSFAHRKGYSGVATYTKVEPLSVEHGMGIERFDDEGRIVTTEFEDFTLLNVYFPNGKRSEERLRYKLDFYDAFLQHCQDLREQGQKLVICGDYNTAHTKMDLARPDDNSSKSGFLPIEREWMDELVAHGYVDTFRKLHSEEEKYSYWDYRTRARSRNVGWRIDYHFVTEDLANKVSDADIRNDIMGSDHCPVGLTLNLK